MIIDPPNDLDRQNLLMALQLIGEQLKRYNDAQPVTISGKREPEFGKANYTNRERSEQGEELHSALDPSPAEAKQVKARTRRRL